MYCFSAALQSAKVIDVPLLEEQDFAFDLAGVLEKMNENTKIIFLCSPNNPTGNTISNEKMKLLCEKVQGQAIVVVDEAYIEFSAGQSATQLITQYSNVVVLRTLSKAWGLAGLRLGTLIADDKVIAALQAIMSPYPFSEPVLASANEAISPTALALCQQRITYIVAEREWLFNQFLLLPVIEKCWVSEANFILVKFFNAKRVFQGCLEQGILLRDLSNGLFLDNCLRVSVGLAAENRRLIQVLKEIGEKNATT
jgi:histidinol-phosphate aminotransferase